MKRVRVVVELPEWVYDAIKAAPMPVDLCGATVADRLGFLAVEYADAEIRRLVEVSKRKERRALYRKLGLPLPPPPGYDSDDDIPF